MDQQSTSGSQTIDNNYTAANNVKEAPSVMEQDHHLHSTKQNSIHTGETTTP